MASRLGRMRMSRFNIGLSLRQRDMSTPVRPTIDPNQIYSISGTPLTTIAGESLNIIINPIQTISGDNLTTLAAETLITI
jgi:hypothetical protein